MVKKNHIGQSSSSLKRDSQKVHKKTTEIVNKLVHFKRKVRSEFGFSKILITMLVLFIIWYMAIFQPIVKYYTVSRRIENCIRLYAIVVKIWNVHSSLQAMLVTTLLHRDKYTSFGMPIEKSFESKLKLFQEELIPELESYISKDLGSFEETFKKLTGELKMCDRVLNKDLILYENCGVGALSFMNGNIISILRQISSILDKSYLSYKKSQSKPNFVKDLFRDSAFKAYFFYGGVLEASGIGVVAEVYYSVLKDLAGSIEDIVRPYSTDKSIDVIWVKLILKYGITTFFLYVLLWGFVFRLLMKKPTSIYNIYFLIPLDLLITNVWLIDRFKKKMKFK